jgi:peptidase S51-like protein
VTKYILAGGNDRLDDTYGTRLAIEIRKQFAGPVRLLSCFFADPEGVWSDKASYWETWFRMHLGDDLQYAVASLEQLELQVKTADVVYLHGGESNELIVERMKAFPDVAEDFAGKVVVGSSAGANYLSCKFWTRSKRQVMDGAGIVPYGMMVHYGSVDGGFGSGSVDWANAERAVRDAVGPDIEILKIPEGQFVVIDL